MREWLGDAAVITQFTGKDEVIAADSLVIAACNRPEAGWRASSPNGASDQSIGDTVAARTSIMAIHEGAKPAWP